MTNASKPSITIKKYANRRLYNTATSTYVTLENLSQMVKEGIEFNVYDAKTSEDITRSVLTQIIVEEEGKAGQNLLPISFMRQLIGFYGDSMQWMVPKYLDQSMQSLSQNQEQIRSYFKTTFGNMFPFGTALEDMGKQNLAVFERAMRMFAPFPSAAGEGKGGFVKPEVETPEAEQAEPVAEAPVEKPTKAQERAQKQREQAREGAEEAAFTPSSKVTNINAQMPTPATNQASKAVLGDEVQSKIAALQRQLSDIAKNKA